MTVNRNQHRRTAGRHELMLAAFITFDTPEIAGPAMKTLTAHGYQLRQGELDRPKIWVFASKITTQFTQELFDEVQAIVEPAGLLMQVGVASDEIIADWIFIKAQLPGGQFTFPFGEPYECDENGEKVWFFARDRLN